MRASDLIVQCLENEGVTHVFGLPGEEILDVLDSLSQSKIRFISTRHEQGAAFMADVYGRLSGRAGVCLSTLGPGATNLVTGIADAYLDRAPMVALTGQADLGRIHKESHQYIDVIRMMRPITKWNQRIGRPNTIPEIFRKAFKIAQMEKPGPTHIEIPENIAAMEVQASPLKVLRNPYATPSAEAARKAARIISHSQHPIILAGNGVIRRRARAELEIFAQRCQIPVAFTFMGKGAIDAESELSLGAVGLQARDWVLCGFERSDTVITVGYDFVEYSPRFWNATQDKTIIHIDSLPSEIDECYLPEVEIIGDIKYGLRLLTDNIENDEPTFPIDHSLRDTIRDELDSYRSDEGFPVKPQRLIADLREALNPQDIVLSDVGAHKIWLARLFPAQLPNTILISNGFASMGFALPGAVAAKLLYPDRNVVAVVGDGGFLMNSQELETAKRVGANIVIIVWEDKRYALIEWKQMRRYGNSYGVTFDNPEFEQYAKAYGLPGFSVKKTEDFLPTLRKALTLDSPVIIQVPLDYMENLRLAEKLGKMVCPI